MAFYIPLLQPFDVWLALRVTMMMGLLYVAWRGVAKINGPVLFISLSVISVALFGVVRDNTRYALLQNIEVFPTFPSYWVAGAKILDEVGTPHRIAVTAGPDRRLISWPMYYFLGSRYQNKLVYIPVTMDGTIKPLIPGIEEKADYLSWQHRLVDTKIDNVVSFKPNSVELKWMEQHRDRFQRMFDDGNSWGIYKVLGEPT